MDESDSDYGGLTEQQLVILAQGGDPHAFVELTNRTRQSVLRTATSILRDSDAAQDQLQNAYLNAWRQIGSFRSEAKFSTWIGRIVTNQCLMALRSRRVSPVQFYAGEDSDVVLEVPDNSPTSEVELGQRQEHELLRAELSRVPLILRRTLTLIYFAEKSIPDAAAELGISVSAFKSRLSRARTFLRDRLVKHYPDRHPAGA